jgi:hypothetical protein
MLFFLNFFFHFPPISSLSFAVHSFTLRSPYLSDDLLSPVGLVVTPTTMVVVSDFLSPVTLFVSYPAYSLTGSLLSLGVVW